MNKEDKELLLIDLSARLPYRTVVDIKYNKEHGSSDRLRICSEGSLTLNTDLISLYIEEEIHLKPYLRPMSSMTDEEREEYQKFLFPCPDCNGKVVIGVYHRDLDKVYDWLNTHHFDYRGLIEKGLAIEMKEKYENTKEII